MPLVAMSRAGPGNVGGAGAASSVDAVGTGKGHGAQRCWGQHWWALLSLLRASPGGDCGAQTGRRGRGRVWGISVSQGAGLGQLSCFPRGWQQGWAAVEAASESGQALEGLNSGTASASGLNSCCVQGPFLIGTNPGSSCSRSVALGAIGAAQGSR